MEFGHWIRNHRTVAMQIDVRTASTLTGVDGSTISRIENLHTQPTLATVLRLCEGYGLALGDMIPALVGKEVTAELDVPQSDTDRHVLTITDTVNFIQLVGTADTVSELLAESISIIAKHQAHAQRQPVPPPLIAADISKMLSHSEVYQLTLNYPGNLTAEMLEQVYSAGGVMTFQDVGAYVRAARQSRSTTLSALEEKTRSSASVLSRIETGTLERVKLGDVLSLNKTLTPDSNLVLAMFWQAAQLYDALRFQVKIDEQSVRALDVAEVLVIVYRWWQQLGLDGNTWLTQLRKVIYSR